MPMRIKCREELQSVLEGWIILGLNGTSASQEVDGRLDAVLESV